MNYILLDKRTETEVIIVSSQKDAHSSFVYPTYAYSVQKTYPNLHLLPDPCKITVNNVTIGLSSTDILGHIQDFEVAMYVTRHNFTWWFNKDNLNHRLIVPHSNAGDKVRRIFNYLLHQRSFYPLSPPSEDVALDSELARDHASLDIVPNVMILPSSMKYFIRVSNFRRKMRLFSYALRHLIKLFPFFDFSHHQGIEPMPGDESGTTDHLRECARHIWTFSHHSDKRVQFS